MYKVYSAKWCRYCDKLKKSLDKAGIEYENIDIDEDIEQSYFLIEKNHTTIPQVYYGDHYIGGCEATMETLNLY